MVTMKRMLGMVLLLILMMSTVVFADSGVYDHGNLFTSEETAELQEEAAEIAQKYDMNIFLLTTDDAKGMTSAEYAEDFYESGNYHQNDAKGGIVLIIDMDHRQLNLVTYGDMIYRITDEREEKIYDAGYDEVSDGDYADCMEEMLETTEKYLKKGIKSLDFMEVLLALGVALVCALIPCLIVWKCYSIVGKYDYSLKDNAEMDLKWKEDHMIDKIVTHRRKPKPDSDGGHGGSGTSVHHSSGGNSVGGGHGRNF